MQRIVGLGCLVAALSLGGVSCGTAPQESTSVLYDASGEPAFVSRTRQLSAAEVAEIRRRSVAAPDHQSSATGEQSGAPLLGEEPGSFALQAAGVITTVLNPLLKTTFASDEPDFGYLTIGSAVPDGSDLATLTGGESLLGPCYEKRVDSFLGATILAMSYCIEASVKKKHNGSGSYIMNTTVEVLDQWGDEEFTIDPLYDLNVRVKSFDAENVAAEGEDPIASLKFAVHFFLDGPASFDVRATDKFIVRGDKTLLTILQVHELR